MKKFMSVLFAMVFLSLMAVAAEAAIDSPVVFDEDIPNIVGIGVGMVPDYQGSNDYKVAPAPFVRINLGGERYVQLLATEINVNILNHPILRFGPSLNYRPGRSDSVKDDQVKNMEKIDGAIEAGAFVGFSIKATNPRQRFIANLDWLHDMSNVSKGNTVTLSGRYWYPISKPIDISLGVSTTYADRKYMETYFGVTKQNVGTSGLPLFDASGMMKDATISPVLVYHLSQSWHLGIGLRYQRLFGDAAESPVTELRGNANQYMYGVAVAYSW